VNTATVPYAGSTGEYTVAAWVLYDDGSEGRLEEAFDCTLEGDEGAELVQSEDGWKLTLYPTVRGGSIILKIDCDLDGRQLSDQMSFVLTREADRMTALEISGEERISFAGGTTTKQYTLSGRNQYGEEMPADNAVWSLTQAAEGVTIDPATGRLTISTSASQNVTLRVECGGLFAEKAVALQYQPVYSGGSYRPKEETTESKPEETPEEIAQTPQISVEAVEQETPLTEEPRKTEPLPPAAEETPDGDANRVEAAGTQPPPQEAQPAEQQEEEGGKIGGVVAAVAAGGTATAAAALGWKWKKKRRRRIM